MIFLIYLHLRQVIDHSMIQLVLLYQVTSNWCLYNELIFLIYIHSLHILNHSIIQLVSLSQVYSNSLSSADVPFKNGKYTHGQPQYSWQSPAFYSLSRSSIHSDSSLFLIIHFIHSLYKSQTTNIILLKELRITLHLILFLLQYTQSSPQSSPHSITISKKSKYHHHHSPHSITISKKSKSPSSLSPLNHNIEKVIITIITLLNHSISPPFPNSH